MKGFCKNESENFFSSDFNTLLRSPSTQTKIAYGTYPDNFSGLYINENKIASSFCNLSIDLVIVFDEKSVAFAISSIFARGSSKSFSIISRSVFVISDLIPGFSALKNT